MVLTDRGKSQRANSPRGKDVTLWAGGKLQVFEEHLFTRHLVHFLEVAMSRVGRPPGAPEVLLATLPGERHALGLLMAEALFLHAGRAALSLNAVDLV